MMIGRPVQGSIVIANYSSDNWLKNHRGKGQNRLFVMLSQEIHNKMPMLPSEETLPIIIIKLPLLLKTARILWGSVTAQLQSEPGNQNSLVPAWSLTKEQRGYWSPSGVNPSSGSEHAKVVVTARAISN